LRAVTFPESWRNTPFPDLLEEYLERLGVEFQKVGSDYLGVQWILQQRGQVNVMHFHFLQYHYLRDNALSSWFALLKFCFKILLAKIVGYRIVWTMHNLLPHDREQGYLDHACYYIFAHLSDSIITLCHNANVLLGEKYGRRKHVFTGYHGHYCDSYPNEIDGAETRERLGIPPDTKVFLFFGNVKPYKGIEKLINAFHNLENPDLCLIIVGRVTDLDYQSQILACIGKDYRIKTVLEWIPEKDVQLYFNACDFVVLPFVEVMTSGSTILALCFNRAVIAPAIGCLPEVITPDTGILYDPAQPDGLLEAMRRCVVLDAARMGEGARQSVMRFTWEELAKVTMQAYQAG